MKARTWAAFLLCAWGLGGTARAGVTRIDIELRDKTVDGTLRCTITKATPADKGLWSDYSPNTPPSFEWRLSSYCTKDTLPTGKDKHEVRVFEFKATGACDNPPMEPPFPYPLRASAGPGLVDYLAPAASGATVPVPGFLGGDAASNIDIQGFEEHCWGYSMKVNGLKPVDPELRLKGSSGRIFARAGLSGPEVMVEVRLKEVTTSGDKKKCVVEHKPAVIDVPYKFYQAPSIAWRVKNLCGPETGVLPGGRHVVSVSVAGTKGADASAAQTPFEVEFLFNDAVVVQAGSAEQPREGTIRGAVRGSLPICADQEVTWTYRLSADYRVDDAALELRFKGVRASDPDPPGPAGATSQTVCNLLAW